MCACEWDFTCPRCATEQAEQRIPDEPVSVAPEAPVTEASDG